MTDLFDELYNEFFSKKDKINGIIKSLQNFKSLGPEEMKSMSSRELGEPNIVEHSIINGFSCTKYTWKTPKGTFVRVIVSDTAEEELYVSFEDQLEAAKKVEDWDLAIELMAKINSRKKS